jgi:hypothetical protein
MPYPHSDEAVISSARNPGVQGCESLRIGMKGRAAPGPSARVSRWASRTLAVKLAALLYLLSLALVVVVASTASAADHDLEQWSSLRLDHESFDRVTVGVRARVRFDDDISNKKDLTVGPSLRWEVLDRLRFSLGYDYLYDLFDDSTQEHRAWQSVRFEFALRDFTIGNRIRFDERFIDDVSGVVSRFRYRLRTTYDLEGVPLRAVGWRVRFARDGPRRFTSEPSTPKGVHRIRSCGYTGATNRDGMRFERQALSPQVPELARRKLARREGLEPPFPSVRSYDLLPVRSQIALRFEVSRKGEK